MPARNSIKIFIEDSYYHVYNRGVEKRIIFQDDQDYKVLLNYLKEYLSPPPDTSQSLQKFVIDGSSYKGLPHLRNNYFNKIELIAYCLMPNHYHFLIKQIDKDSMEYFIRSIFTRYTMYFNKKYERVGTLFQGIYKAVLISNENYLLHLSRYIHLNPSEYVIDLVNVYSSYGDYLGLRNTTWVKPGIVKSYFSKKNEGLTSYKSFVESQIEDEEMLKGYTID